jgi:hypothetical protein
MLLPFSIQVAPDPKSIHRANIARQNEKNLTKSSVQITAAGQTPERHETPAPERTLMEGGHLDLENG